VSEKIQTAQTKASRRSSRMPVHSLFFEKVVPVLLGLFGLVMVGLVIFAAGVLLGWIKF